MDRCHLYLPLVDSSGGTYAYAEVTLLDPETGTPIEEQVYLEPHGGAPQRWPILIDPAVINLWTDRPLRVTVQALLPGGSTLTRTGVDITAAPSATVRTREPLRIGSSEGLDSSAVLAVSPDGSATWQVLDALRFHRHDGDAPGSTVLGPEELTDIYPGQTWLGRGIAGSQGSGATVLGSKGSPAGDEATVLGQATAAARGLAAGAGANAGPDAVAVGAGSQADRVRQVVLGRGAAASGAGEGSVVIGAGTAAGAASAVTVGDRLALVAGDGPAVVLQGDTVVGGSLDAPVDAVLAGAASLLGFYGAAGAIRPQVSSVGVAAGTPGRAALLSLLSALDQLGLIQLLPDNTGNRPQ